MLGKTTAAYDALITWEQGGEWPEADDFIEIVREVAGLEALALRYRRLIDSCEANENLRHSQPSSLPTSTERPVAGSEGFWPPSKPRGPSTRAN